MKKTFLPISLIFAFSFIGCSMDDEDRCVENYVWDADLKMCISDTSDDPVDTEPTGPDTEANGVGAVCMENEDCQQYEATTACLFDPSAPNDPGYCSVWGCVADDCGVNYACCDCTESPTGIVEAEEAFCVHNDDVGVMESVVQCVCNE